MSTINEFLIAMSWETAQQIYETCIVLSVLVCVPYLWYISKKYALDATERKLLVVYPLIMVATTFLARGAENGMIVRKSTAAAILLTAALCGQIAELLHKSAYKTWDIVLPMGIAARALMPIGCTFTGCCGGTSVLWGLYSRIHKTTVVPIPIMDSIASICIFCKAMQEMKQKKYSGDGETGAKTLIAFGVLRFLSDLLRANTKWFGRMSFDSIIAFVMIATGYGMLHSARKERTKILSK